MEKGTRVDQIAQRDAACCTAPASRSASSCSSAIPARRARTSSARCRWCATARPTTSACRSRIRCPGTTFYRARAGAARAEAELGRLERPGDDVPRDLRRPTSTARCTGSCTPSSARASSSGAVSRAVAAAVDAAAAPRPRGDQRVVPRGARRAAAPAPEPARAADRRGAADAARPAADAARGRGADRSGVAEVEDACAALNGRDVERAGWTHERGVLAMAATDALVAARSGDQPHVRPAAADLLSDRPLQQPLRVVRLVEAQRRRRSRRSPRFGELASALPALGTRVVVFSGGEPLLRPEVFDAAADLPRAGDDAAPADERRAARTLRGPRRAAVRPRHRVARRGERAVSTRRSAASTRWRSSGAASRRCADLAPDVPVTARATLHRLNFRELPRLVDHAKSLALDGISFLPADMSSSGFGRAPVADGAPRTTTSRSSHSTATRSASSRRSIEHTIARYAARFRVRVHRRVARQAAPAAALLRRRRRRRAVSARLVQRAVGVGR